MGTLGYSTRIAAYTCVAALVGCSTGESRLDEEDGRDASVKHDAGNQHDAGNRNDAGNDNDSGTPNDGGSDNDTGTPNDGGSDAPVSDGGCITCYVDADEDGYAVAGADSDQVCGALCAKGFTSRAPAVGARDCNDTDKLIFPGAPERCNNVSDNCDTVVDEGAAATCSVPNATAQCTSGQCRVQTCSSGYGDCTATSGCEQPLNVAAHCGACGRTCPALSACSGAIGSARCQCATTTFEVPSTSGTFSCMGNGPLAVGNGVVCAIASTGAVSCWGGSPPAATARFKQLTLGAYFAGGAACGVTQAGAIQCWTAHDPIIAPPPAPPAGSTYLTASLGNALCGINTSARAVCSGGPATGGPSATRLYRQIATGFGFTCALATDGNVTCWGQGESAEPNCGTGGYDCGQSVPLAGPFVQIALGVVHSCGLRPNGTVACWGAGLKALEPGTFELRQGVAPAVPFRYIAAAAHTTCGIRAIDNALQCWGGGYQTSAGTTANPPSGEYDMIAAGEQFACALAKTGVIRCWGNLDGLNGSAIPATLPGTYPLIPPG